jgi:NAD(P)-dependent dehydrogenase (short-subunit alcohol dehydrogenase family)
MQILVIGATGTIGSAVTEALRRKGHAVHGASRHARERVDIEEPASVRALFERLGDLDAVVCCAGSAAFAPLAALSDDDFAHSLRSKLMGQVQVTRRAFARLRDGGSITLTSGVLAFRPMPGSAAVSLVNAALEGFVRAAALEAPRGVRVNAVSPPWVAETLAQLKMDPRAGLPAAEVATYVAAVEGQQRGQILELGEPMRAGEAAHAHL